MEALASPTSSRVVFGKYRYRETGFVERLQVCFLRPQKSGDFRFLNLVAFLQPSNPIRAITCLASKAQTELETADVQIQEIYQTKTIHVKFQLEKECKYGEQFLIVGDDPIFGMWEPSSAIPMDWSDGNVWTVELDVPVGKAIQFKFILKESTGNILWQPGPDRIFQTWETKNKITVCEDWGDAEAQKIIEEEQVSNPSEDFNVNPDMLIVSEKLTLPIEEPTIADSNTDPSEKPLMEQNFSDSISPSQEKHKFIAAENIIPKWPRPLTEPCKEQIVGRTEVLNEERVTFPNVNSAAISDMDLLVAENIFGNNGRAATVRNLANTHIEGSLINYEEGPVLVPGLTPSPTVPTEEAKKEEVEKQMSFGGSVGAFEANDLNMPELDVKQKPYSDPPQAETTDMINDNEEKQEPYSDSPRAETTEMINDDEEKQEPYSDPPLAETTDMIKDDEEKQEPYSDPPLAETTDMIKDNKENFDGELKKMPHPAKRDEHSDSEPINDDVLHNDLQWGRKMLQKLLSNFRFL